MEPRIVSRDAFHVVGMAYVGTGEGGAIPAMYDRFMTRVPEIANRAGSPHEFYGVCSMPEGLPPGAFEYIAGVEVCSLDAIPDGMVGRTIPAQTYAVFPVESLADIHAAWDRAYCKDLPENGLEPSDLPGFEFYDASFDPEKGGPLYLYIGIKR